MNYVIFAVGGLLLCGATALLAGGPDPGCCVLPDSCTLFLNPDDGDIEHCEKQLGVWITGDECPADCNSGLGACCRDDGSCVVSNEAWCRLVLAPGNSVWMGADTTCQEDCSLGACCLADQGQSCIVVPLAFCNGLWNAGQECGEADACASTCRSDLSGDGTVDIIDFLILLQDWGPCK